MSRRVIPSTPSLENSQQAHINDLVQRNRTSEQTIHRLQTSLQNEKNRSKEALADLQARWQEERGRLASNFDDAQTTHRLVEYRTADKLQLERLALLAEQDATRREKVARLQRDYRIITFRIRESELEAKVEDLEEEREALLQKHSKALERMKLKNAELIARINELTNECAEAEAEKEQLEERLTQMIDATFQRQASSDSATEKLARVSLQLEGAHTKIAELTSANNDLKQSNSAMQLQISKWESLETKGATELDTLRKQRMDLEIEVSSLRNKAEKKDDEGERIVDKLNSKLEKFKANVIEWKEHSESLETEKEELEKKLQKLESRNAKLKSDLEVERARVKPSSPQKAAASLSLFSGESDISDNENEAVVDSPPASPRKEAQPQKSARNKPAAKQAEAGPSRKRQDATDDETDAMLQRKPRPQPKRKKATAAADSDVEEVAAPTKAGKGKGKGSDTHADRAPSMDSEVQIIGSSKPGKKSTQSADAEAKPKRARKREGTAALGSGNAPGQPKRGRSITGDSAPATSTEGGDDDAPADADAPKKKKRKINVFSSAAPATFNFSTQGTSNALNIPTELSPVKESEVPARSGTSAMSKLWGFRR